jgi:hypothetical protein
LQPGRSRLVKTDMDEKIGQHGFRWPPPVDRVKTSRTAVIWKTFIIARRHGD